MKLCIFLLFELDIFPTSFISDHINSDNELWIAGVKTCPGDIINEQITLSLVIIQLSLGC